MPKTILITGATSGIGLALAQLFAKDGDNLIIVARKKADLDQTKNLLEKKYSIKVKTFAVDLSDFDQVTTFIKKMKKESIDILINNAGFGDVSEFIDQDEKTMESMIQLNITTLIRLTRAILPGMQKRGSGKILQLGSMASFMPGPHQALYYATKAFVLSFTEALAIELKSSPITVTCLCPGPVTTNFAKTAHAKNVRAFQKGATAEFVAKKGYKALMKGQVISLPKLIQHIQLFLLKLMPRKTVAKISGKMMERI